MIITNAQYKENSTKTKILTGIISCVLVFVIQYLTNNYLSVITMNLIQPGLALNPVLGIFFGWPAVIGCAAGSFIENLICGNGLLISSMVVVVDFISGALPYMLWHMWSSGETHIYRLDSHRRVLRYTVVCLANSAICGLLLAFLEAYLYGTLDYILQSFLYDTLDYFDMAMLIGLPLMMIISFFMHRFYSEDKKFRGLITTEKIVVFYVLAEILFVVVLMLTLWITRTEDQSFWDVFSNSYVTQLITENVMVVCLIFVLASAVNRDAIMKALDKIAVAVCMAAFIVFTVQFARIGLRSLTPVAAGNAAIYLACLGFAAALLFALILDKQTVNKESALYVAIVFVIGVSLSLNLSEILISDPVIVSYIEMFISIVEVINTLLCAEFVNVSIKLSGKKYKIIMWGMRIVCMIMIIVYIANFWTDASPTWLAYGALLLYAIFAYIICKEGKDFYEKLSLIVLMCLGAVAELVFYQFNKGLYLTPCGGMFGALLCFTNIYVKRSNSLSDTKRDLDVAATIQLSMLPKDFHFDDFNNIDIFASMDPAKEVGGDFYDFYKLSDKHIAFVIADVSGKGLPGAMLMMRAITAIKNFAMAGMPVNKIMEMSSNNINEHNEAMLFVTCWMGMLNVETGKMRFVNAGHNPPIIRHADGTTEEIKTRPDLIMGFFPGAKYNKREMYLRPGDTLYLYTDGVTEAFSDYEQQYGMDRLHEALRQPAENSKILCENVTADVDKFVGTADQFDDMTMIAIKYKGPLDRSKAVEVAPEKFNMEDLADNFIDIESLTDSGSGLAAAASAESSENSVRFEETEGTVEVDFGETAEPKAAESSGSEIKIEVLGEDFGEELKIEPLGQGAPASGASFESYGEAIEIEPIGQGAPASGASFESYGEAIKIEPLGEEAGDEIKIELLGEEAGDEIKIEPLGQGAPASGASFESYGEAIEIEPLGEESGEEIKIEALGSYSHVVFAETDVAAPESIEILNVGNNHELDYNLKHVDELEKEFSEDEESASFDNSIPADADPQDIQVYNFGEESRVIELIASRDNVYTVTEEIDRYLEDIGCTMSAQAKIDIAFDEIYSNVVNYAYNNVLGKCRVLMTRVQGPNGSNGVRISIVDRGKAYNPLEHMDPDSSRSLEQRSHGGVGVFMVKRTMDEVSYARINNNNRLTFTKYF